MTLGHHHQYSTYGGAICVISMIAFPLLVTHVCHTVLMNDRGLCMYTHELQLATTV